MTTQNQSANVVNPPGESERTDADRESLLRFFDTLGARRIATDSPGLRRHLAKLFELERVNFQKLALLTWSAIATQPELKQLVEDAEQRDSASIERRLEMPENLVLLDDPLLHRLLRRTIVSALAAERLLTQLRRIFLDRVTLGEAPLNESHFRLMVSLACQCFNNEYIYAVDESGEVAELERRLRETIAGGKEMRAEELVVYAMYAPLWTLGEGLRISKTRWAADQPDLDELIGRQIREHAEEKAIRKEIDSFGT